MPKKILYVFLFLLAASSLLASTVTAASTTLLVERFSYQDSKAEYVKIKNISAAGIDLTGYKVGDEETKGGGEGMYDLPTVTLAAGDSLIIAKDADNWDYSNPSQPNYSFLSNSVGVPVLIKYSTWAKGSFGLNNDGDEVIILDSGDNLVDGVCYGDSSCNFNDTGNDTILIDGSLPDLPTNDVGYKRNNDVDTDAQTDWLANPNAITLANLSAKASADGRFLWGLGSLCFGLIGVAVFRRKH